MFYILRLYGDDTVLCVCKKFMRFSTLYTNKFFFVLSLVVLDRNELLQHVGKVSFNALHYIRNDSEKLQRFSAKLTYGVHYVEWIKQHRWRKIRSTAKRRWTDLCFYYICVISWRCRVLNYMVTIGLRVQDKSPLSLPISLLFSTLV
jgi:hypothetical protein